jgi:hypothetical protein
MVTPEGWKLRKATGWVFICKKKTHRSTLSLPYLPNGERPRLTKFYWRYERFILSLPDTVTSLDTGSEYSNRAKQFLC